MSKRIIKIFSILLFFVGVFILSSSLYPILSYEWESGFKYSSLISPLPDAERERILSERQDYTKASNWFPETKDDDFSSQNISYYTLSIPKLKIENATVALGGEDLSQSLIQYPGTANPGKGGNAVVFGHSALPFFYNPDNYLTIFSNLGQLEKDDEIVVNYDGITYKYKIEDMFEVRPTDIQILEQNRNGSFLTLVTCTPPGDPRKPKRLIVRARLVPFFQANGNIGY